MHDDMSEIVPTRVTGPCAAEAPDHSSNEDPQTFAAILPPCNLNMQTDIHVQPYQGFVSFKN